MQTAIKQKSRAKKKVPEMYPVKKWLTLQEACSYMDMSTNRLRDLVSKKGLTVSVIGDKTRYKVVELEALIEDNILIRKVN